MTENKIAQKTPTTKSWIIVLLLSFMIIISVIQAVELANLRNSINSIGDLNKNQKTFISTGTTSNLQRGLENLPGMVGGC